MRESLATPLRILRVERGLSLSETAEKTGIDRHTLSRIESGVQKPSAKTIKRLAEFYEISVEELLLWEPQTPKAEAPQSGLLAKAKDAVRRDMRRESQAIQRAHASERPQSVSGYEEDQFRAELRSLDFEHIFEKVLWPAVQEAVEADQLREENAKLQEEAARLREAEDYASRETDR